MKNGTKTKGNGNLSLTSQDTSLPSQKISDAIDSNKNGVNEETESGSSGTSDEGETKIGFQEYISDDSEFADKLNEYKDENRLKQKSTSPDSISDSAVPDHLNSIEPVDENDSNKLKEPYEIVQFNSRLLGNSVAYALTQPFGDDHQMDAFTRRCTNCRKVGHDRRNCPHPKKEMKTDLIKRCCRTCNSRDHDRRTCPFESRNPYSDEETQRRSPGVDGGTKEEDLLESSKGKFRAENDYRKLINQRNSLEKYEQDLEKEWDLIRYQFSQGKKNLRPRIVYSTFPYDLATLQWDSFHIENEQQHYCYCGRAKHSQDIAQKPMISCGNCQQLFHFDCVNVLESPLLCGDDAYIFRCSMCNDDDNENSENGEFYERTTQSWTNILRITLCNLLLRYAERSRRYFSISSHISRFIQKYWSSLSMEKTVAVDMQELLSKELSDHPEYFVKDSIGDWTLTLDGIPSNRSGIPTIVHIVVKEETKRRKNDLNKSPKSECIAFYTGSLVLASRKEYPEKWPAQVISGGAGRLHIRFLGNVNETKWIKSSLVENYPENYTSVSDTVSPDYQEALDEAKAVLKAHTQRKRPREESDDEASLSGEESRRNYQKINEFGVSYRCSTCLDTFKTLYSLEKHINLSHNELSSNPLSMNENSIENLEEKNIEYLYHQGDIQMKPRDFKCDLCDRAFSYNAGLVLHMRSHKRLPNSVSPTLSTSTNFPCTICNRTFKRPQSLALHLKMHSKKKEISSLKVEHAEGEEAEKGRVYADEVIGHELYIWIENDLCWKKGIVTSLNVEECKHRLDFSSPDATAPQAEWYHLHDELIKWPQKVPPFACEGEPSNLALFQASTILEKKVVNNVNFYFVELVRGDGEEEMPHWIEEKYIYSKKLLDSLVT